MQYNGKFCAPVHLRKCHFFCSVASTCLKVMAQHDDTSALLQRYWALEEVPRDTTVLTKEEQAATTHFQEMHQRTPEGRYVVGLPKREPPIHLGKSRNIALKRFLQNERSL